jgi:TRAP-type uncharacterized transport system fused permease subunit
MRLGVWDDTAPVRCLGFVKLLVPFLFVTMPGLLMIGGTSTIVFSAGLATIGISGLTVALAGWFGRTLTAVQRLAFAGASALVLVPMPVAFDAVNLGVRGAGIAGLIALVTLALRGFNAR